MVSGDGDEVRAADPAVQAKLDSFSLPAKYLRYLDILNGRGIR
jgi:hypothetical protein